MLTIDQVGWTWHATRLLGQYGCTPDIACCELLVMASGCQYTMEWPILHRSEPIVEEADER
jgi:hypothetical protein